MAPSVPLPAVGAYGQWAFKLLNFLSTSWGSFGEAKSWSQPAENEYQQSLELGGPQLNQNHLCFNCHGQILNAECTIELRMSSGCLMTCPLVCCGSVLQSCCNFCKIAFNTEPLLFCRFGFN